MRGGGGGSAARQNAIRSGLVVLGAVAFGYLSFRVGFKPYLDRAQEAMNSHNTASAAGEDSSRTGADPDLPRCDPAASKDPAVVLRD